jgi:hypothetical protein
MGGKAVDWAKRNPRATKMIIRTGLKMMNSDDSGDYGDMDFGGGDSGVDLSGGFDASGFDVSDLGGGGGDMSGVDFSGGADMSGMDFSGGGVDTSSFDSSGIDFTGGGGIDSSSFDPGTTGGLDFSGGPDITDYSSETTFDVFQTTDFTPFGLDNTIDGTGFDYTGMDTTGDVDMAFDNSGASVSSETIASGINADFGLTDEDNTFADDTAADTGLDDSASIPDFGGSDGISDTGNDMEFTSDDIGGGNFSATNGSGDEMQGQDDSSIVSGDDTFAGECNESQGSGDGQFDGSVGDQDDAIQDVSSANGDLSLDDNTNGNDNGTDLGTDDGSGLGAYQDSGTYDDSGNDDNSVDQDNNGTDPSQSDDNNDTTDPTVAGDSSDQSETNDLDTSDNNNQQNQTQAAPDRPSHPHQRPQKRPANRPTNRPTQPQPTHSTHGQKPSSTNRPHRPTNSKSRPPNQQHPQARPPTVQPPQQATRPTRPQQTATPRPRPHSTSTPAIPQIPLSGSMGSGLQMMPTQSGIMPMTSGQPIMVPMTYLDPITGEQKMMLVPMTPMIGATGGMQMQVMAQAIPQALAQNLTSPSQAQMRPTMPGPARRQPAGRIPETQQAQSPGSVSSGAIQSRSKVPLSDIKTNRRVSMPPKPTSSSSGPQAVPHQSGKQSVQQRNSSRPPLRTKMVSVPVLNIHSPYHVMNREMMARILAHQKLEPVPKPQATGMPIMPAPSEGSSGTNPPVSTRPQRRRPPQLSQPINQSSLVLQLNTRNPHPNAVPKIQTTTGTSSRPSSRPQLSRPYPQNTVQHSPSHFQQEDSSDDATSSVDIYDTPLDEVFDARPGTEADLTEYVSYEDALKFSLIVVSDDTALSLEGAVSAVSIEESESGLKMHENNFHWQSAVTEDTRSEEIIVMDQNTLRPVQGQTLETSGGTEINIPHSTSTTNDLGPSGGIAVTEADSDSFMDLDEFNKEIEEARLLRLAQSQVQTHVIPDESKVGTEERSSNVEDQTYPEKQPEKNRIRIDAPAEEGGPDEKSVAGETGPLGCVH